MERREYFADRIYRDNLVGIDKQPSLLNSQIPDISIGDYGLIGVQPPNLPPDMIVRYPPLITTTVEGFKKVEARTTTDVGVAGGVDLEAKGKKISLYIIIGAVVIIGIIAVRR